jgi:type VI secretion system protein ImpC
MASKETQANTTSVVLEGRSVYESLCDKINLRPVQEARPLEAFQDNDLLSESSADERMARAVSVFLKMVGDASRQIDRLDKSLLDFHIGRIDAQISAQLDAVMHSPEFQHIEAAWRGLKFLVDRTDFRKNVKIEVLDVSKEALQQDFEDTPEVIQSGLYRHTYIQEYDTPGGEPIGSIISNYEFDNSPQDVALLRNISKVAASAHMPFIGSASPLFFGKETMEEVAAIQDIGNYFDRAEYIKWKSFRDTDDARYIGLTMPRVLGRLPYGPDTKPVRGFNYQEAVKGPDHNRYLWVNAAFAFAANMVQSFIKNGWCVQIRGPQAGGKVEDLPVHLYDLGTGYQPKIPTEVLIPETREFEFANLGFIPLSFYKNHDFACFFSANSTQKPALYDTKEATANSRINARLPYIFLLSRIAHYLKLIQRENIGTTKDRRLLELELNNWIKNLVTEMTDPGDDLQASHPLREAKVTVEDIEDNPGFFRIKLFIVPHFQVEGMDIGLSLVSQMPKAKS